MFENCDEISWIKIGFSGLMMKKPLKPKKTPNQKKSNKTPRLDFLKKKNKKNKPGLLPTLIG